MINIFYDTVCVNILAPLGITVKTNKYEFESYGTCYCVKKKDLIK